MSKKLLIRCATESIFGLGHFKRCLTLSKELKKFNITSEFLITKNTFIENELKKHKIGFHKISKFTNPDDEISLIINLNITYYM